MRSIKWLSAVGFGLILCFVFTQGIVQQTVADDIAVVSKNDAVSVRVYKLEDLPVYTKDGKFSPDPLMMLIQVHVSPMSWEARGGSSTLAPYFQNASLVISTTSKDHDAIAKLLKSFRP